MTTPLLLSRLGVAGALVVFALACAPQNSEPDIDSAILFTTHVPISVSSEFGSFAATFANHQPAPSRTPRGGDLYIRYEDGTLRNLTEEAGFGLDGASGDNAIAVREPTVHWRGQKALFSMVVGSSGSANWQIYEVSGLHKDEAAVITKIEGQPEYNNISPIYSSDDDIIFASDAPLPRASSFYPLLDEYESQPTLSGIWRLDTDTGQVVILDHAPSGDFNLSIDSYGRVLFARWDHLQRDQQADSDAGDGCSTGSPSGGYGSRTYASELPSASSVTVAAQCFAGDLAYGEVFPEVGRTHPFGSDPSVNPSGASGLRFNHFLAWTMNQDGTELETLNHIGRHELHRYFVESFPDDPDLQEFSRAGATPENLFEPSEDAAIPGRYYMIDAPEFETLSGGPIVRIDGPLGEPADLMVPVYLTGGSDLYRNARGLSSGELIASHSQRSQDPMYRLVQMEQNGELYEPGAQLTDGIEEPALFDGPLWELGAAEVRSRPPPPVESVPLEDPEAGVFTDLGVDVEELRTYLRDNDLALLVSRDVTTRDEADHQQPYNLRVAGTSTMTTAPDPQRIHDVAFMQFVENKLIRGYDIQGSDARRGIAQFMDDAAALAANPSVSGAPSGSVQLGDDGSMAAFVPAQRALSWQLTDPSGEPVVRERYWLTFQPGEIRVCASCHGLNERSQAGQGIPQNEPAALRSLLQSWLAQN